MVSLVDALAVRELEPLERKEAQHASIRPSDR